jgi:hypothetical protein
LNIGVRANSENELADQIVKIIKGNLDGNEIQNAASEVTLQQLLAVMKRMEKQSGTDKKRSTQSQQQNTDAVNDGTRATRALSDAKRTLTNDLKWLSSRGFRLLGQGISGFASGLTNVTENLANYGAEIIASQPEITDFSGALADSRLNILGLGTAIHRLTELLVGNYRSFQTLSQSGIFLGDRISQLQADFASMGIDAATFNRVIAQNAEQFSRFGSASQGASRALIGMRNISSSTREELLSFGISFEEQAEIFAKGFAQNSVALRRGTITQEQVTALSARYARDLRRISELTGASASELEDAARKAEMQTAFAIHLERMRSEGMGEQAKALQAQVEMLYAQNLEGMAEALIAQELNLPALTEASVAALGFVDGAYEAVAQLRNLARSGIDDEEQLHKERVEILKNLADLNKGMDLGTAAIVAQSESGMQELLRIIQAFGFIDSTADSFAGSMDNAGKTIQSFEELLRLFRKGVAEVSKAFFANTTVQSGLISFREWLDYFKTQAQGEWLDRFINGIREFDPSKYNPFDEEGRANIAASFNKLIETMKNAFVNFWQGNGATALRDSISGFFEYLVEELILSINKTTGLLGGSAQRIQIGRLGESDRTAAVTTENTAALTESQQAYRATVDAAVELKKSIDSLGVNISEQDPEAALFASGLQEQYNRLMTQVSEADLQTRMQIDQLMKEYQKQSRIAESGRRSYQRNTAEQELLEIESKLRKMNVYIGSSDIETRRIGTLQATGMRSEPKNTVAQLHAGERVLNPQETLEYNNPSTDINQRDMIKKLDQLNTTMLNISSLIAQELSVQTKTMNRIGGLGPDLIKGIPN